MLGHRVSWLISCVERYRGSLHPYRRFHIGHASFQPALPRKNGAGWLFMYKKIRCRSKFWINFQEIRTLDADPIVLRISQPNGTTDMGENVTLKPVFCFHSASMEFFMKKTYKQYVVPHSPQKRFSSFLSSDAYFTPKVVISPKNYFWGYFGKFVFFFFCKNCSMKNI